MLNFDDPELKKLDLEKEDGSDMMKFFSAMKWTPHRKKYLFNFLVFFSFLIALTVHGTNQIDYLQGNEKCHNIMSKSLPR